MIQRKQTLFLLQSIFFGIALLFVPSAHVVQNTNSVGVYLIPLNSQDLISTNGHLTAIAFNFLSLVLAAISIFLFSKRELQLKLCYLLMLFWVILLVMISFCPFVLKSEVSSSSQSNYFASAICIFGALSAYLAAKFIKKDIELLKSADRIR